MHVKFGKVCLLDSKFRICYLFPNFAAKLTNP
jgi:hypothetical protein